MEKNYFRNLVESMEEENWTKQDLINLIIEEDLDEFDIRDITDFVIEIVEENEENEEDDDFDDDFDDENIDEKMSNKAKKDAAKMRRKPAFKKAKRLKAKCKKKFSKKIANTKDASIPYVCGNDGKLHKGMKRTDRKALKKTRKRNKHKIIN